jgi:hypothetical protein
VLPDVSRSLRGTNPLTFVIQGPAVCELWEIRERGQHPADHPRLAATPGSVRGAEDPFDHHVLRAARCAHGRRLGVPTSAARGRDLGTTPAVSNRWKRREETGGGGLPLGGRVAAGTSRSRRSWPISRQNVKSSGLSRPRLGQVRIEATYAEGNWMRALTWDLQPCTHLKAWFGGGHERVGGTGIRLLDAQPRALGLWP